MSLKKCTWHESGDTSEGWQVGCSLGDAYISGDKNDLQEMELTYTYCPKCGKEIDFKTNEKDVI